jgi:uncharacterized protein (DUF427 family)
MSDLAESNPIRRPEAPEHFMVIRPAEGPVTLRVGATEIARSENALVVQEVSRSVHPAVFYVPRADVREGVLRSIDKQTHCPLKGEASYYDLVCGNLVIPEAAWSYDETLEFDPRIAQLKGMVSFDARHVRLE